VCCQGVEVGDTIRLGRVLAHKADGEFKVGQPYLENVAVEAEIMEEFRGPKVRHDTVRVTVQLP
jgi:ribosomal protein L21